jgi:hypothetical protein
MKWFALLLVASASLAGCADPCEELQEDVCSKCTDAGDKNTCESTALVDDLPLVDADEQCEAMIDDPPPSCK